MSSVSLCFHLHHPLHLRAFTFFELGKELPYFDRGAYEMAVRRQAEEVYLPANRLMLQMVKQYEGAFRLAYAISGPLLQQFANAYPEIVDSFAALAQTGCVEFLGGSSSYSLSFLQDRALFCQEVETYQEMIRQYTGQLPKVLLNTGLLYNNHLGFLAARMGYRAVMTEASEPYLHGRSGASLFHAPNLQAIKVLLRAGDLSEVINRNFFDPVWNAYPLDADTYVNWLEAYMAEGQAASLLIDYEKLGPAAAGKPDLKDFLQKFVKAVTAREGMGFHTPTEVVGLYASSEGYDVPHAVGRKPDLAFWEGNAMQREAMAALYSLKEAVEKTGRSSLAADWRFLQAADHFWYMSDMADEELPLKQAYRTPQNAYIYFMNTIADLQLKLKSAGV